MSHIIINHHCKTFNSLTLPFIFLLFLPLFTPTRAYIFIYAGCSQEKYQPSSPYEANLNSFLTSLVSSSSQTLYNNFALGNSTSTPSDTTIYGLYQCRGDLKPNDCSTCIQSAVSQIGLICPYSYGATLQLEGCYVRYEHYDFVGKPDLTIMYKRCSRSSTSENDAEFFSKRDDVLDALQSGVGFRVSESGSVQGFGQCLGDLSASDCSSCLTEAVKELKILCGSAAAAHVFLAKCYAQYWAAGYYDLSTATSDPTHEDDVAKTVAIIVGIIGGIAVLIVLLSVCRKSCGGAHGGGK